MSNNKIDQLPFVVPGSVAGNPAVEERQALSRGHRPALVHDDFVNTAGPQRGQRLPTKAPLPHEPVGRPRGAAVATVATVLGALGAEGYASGEDIARAALKLKLEGDNDTREQDLQFDQAESHYRRMKTRQAADSAREYESGLVQAAALRGVVSHQIQTSQTHSDGRPVSKAEADAAAAALVPMPTPTVQAHNDTPTGAYKAERRLLEDQVESDDMLRLLVASKPKMLGAAMALRDEQLELTPRHILG